MVQNFEGSRDKGVEEGLKDLHEEESARAFDEKIDNIIRSSWFSGENRTKEHEQADYDYLTLAEKEPRRFFFDYDTRESRQLGDVISRIATRETGQNEYVVPGGTIEVITDFNGLGEPVGTDFLATTPESHRLLVRIMEKLRIMPGVDNIDKLPASQLG